MAGVVNDYIYNIGFFMFLTQINEFVRYLTTEKRYSQHTVAAYKNDLVHLASYLNMTYEIGETGMVQPVHLRSWLVVLREEGMEPRTVNRKLSAVRVFFKFLLTTHTIQKNPALSLRQLKTAERLPMFLKETEVTTLLDSLSFEPGITGATERLILELLYQTGMRRAELAALSVNDIDWAMHQIRVTGKGNKMRILPVSASLANMVSNYLNIRQEVVRDSEKKLLVRHTGNPVTSFYIYSVVRKYLSMVTTIAQRSPHILRHSFATHLLNNGANIQAIKELLGHTSLAATQIYTHTSIDKLKEIHSRNHPRG